MVGGKRAMLGNEQLLLVSMALQNDLPRPPGELPVTIVTLEICFLTEPRTNRARPCPRGDSQVMSAFTTKY